MANRKQRRHPAKPQGFTFADQLQRQRVLKEAAQKAANDTMVQVKADIHTQRALWLACVSMNDAFQIGPERFKKFAECLQARSDWYEDLVKGGDEEYANEKLRQEAERCSGMEIEYLYEAEIRAAKKAIDWEPGCLYERIRMMTVDEMARYIPEELLGLQGAMLELAESRWKRELRGK